MTVLLPQPPEGLTGMSHLLPQSCLVNPGTAGLFLPFRAVESTGGRTHTRVAEDLPSGDYSSAAFNPSPQAAEAGASLFQVGLAYILSSRPAKAIERDPVSKTNKIPPAYTRGNSTSCSPCSLHKGSSVDLSQLPDNHS